MTHLPKDEIKSIKGGQFALETGIIHQLPIPAQEAEILGLDVYICS